MRITVIGAGFSGLLTAVHLLRLSPNAYVSLIERGPAFGPGTAYSTTNPDHVLNVRLTNMSAFPDQPSDLLNWLSQQDGWRATDQFITRGMYGRYLRSLMRTACGSDRRLRQVSGEAVDVERVGGGWSVTLASGERLITDVVDQGSPARPANRAVGDAVARTSGPHSLKLMQRKTIGSAQIMSIVRRRPSR